MALRFPLRLKLFALTTVIVALLMATVTYVYTIREQKSRRFEVDHALARITTGIATLQLLDRQDWTVYQNYISQLVLQDRDIVYIAVYDDRQVLRAQALNPRLIDADLPARLSAPAEQELVRRLDRGAVAEESRADLITQEVNILTGERVLGSVHVGQSIVAINDELREGILRNLAIGLALVAVGGLLSFVLGRRLAAPLERLNQAMAKVAEGDFVTRVETESRDEIGELALRFNEMVEGLDERRVIVRLGLELAGTFQRERLSDLVRLRVGGALAAEAALLYLRDRDERGSFRRETTAEGEVTAPNLRLESAALAALIAATDGFGLGEAQEALRAPLAAAGLQASDLVIPMPVKGQIVGLLVLRAPPASPGFSRKQRDLAGILARQAGLALENTQLYEALRDEERLRGELQIARDVQRKLLPERMPAISGLDIDGVCAPAHEVGGDYFDFFPLGPRHLGVAIADVSGKGTSASFYMAEIKGMMMSLAPIYPSPRRLLAELNRHLYRSLERRVFATMVYGVVEIAERRFTFARAGHTPALVWQASGKHEILTPPGLSLGLEPGELFDEVLRDMTVPFAPGDTLVLYTDGITEAMNGEGEPFGMDRLLAASRPAPLEPAATVRARVLAEVASFAGKEPQSDDLTMVVLRATTAAAP